MCFLIYWWKRHHFLGPFSGFISVAGPFFHKRKIKFYSLMDIPNINLMSAQMYESIQYSVYNLFVKKKKTKNKIGRGGGFKFSWKYIWISVPFPLWKQIIKNMNTTKNPMLRLRSNPKDLDGKFLNIHEQHKK